MKLALPERLWTPRLKSFDNDKRLAEASPLLELFSFRFSTRVSHSPAQKLHEEELRQATIQSVLSSELAAVHEWWTWNIGDFFIPWVVTSSELNSLLVSQYIELLYQRCSLLIGDPEALKVLLAEQHFIYDFCESIPTQLNVFGKGDSDSSSSLTDYSLDEGVSGGCLPEYPCQPTPTPVPRRKTIKKPVVEDSSDGESSYGEYESEEDHVELLKVSKRNRPKKEPLKLPQTTEELESFCARLLDLIRMFWSAESENVLEELVTVVRILKLVIRTISGIKKLIPPFKESGLAARLQDLTKRGAGHERIHPNVALSYQKRDWAFIFGEILTKILHVDSPRDKSEQLSGLRPYVLGNSKGFVANDFLSIIGHNPELLLLRSYPSNAMALTGGRAFEQAYISTVAPSLASAGFPIDNTLDPAEIYRHITWSDYFRNVATMERSGFADLIILLFKLSLLFRTFVREVNSTVYNPEHPSAAIEALGAEMERLKKEPYAYTTFDKAAKKRDKKKRSRKGKNEKYKEAGVERKKKRRRRDKSKKRGPVKPAVDVHGDVVMGAGDEGRSSRADTDGVWSEGEQGRENTDDDMVGNGMGVGDVNTDEEDDQMADAPPRKPIDDLDDDDASSDFHQPRRHDIPKPVGSPPPSRKAAYAAPPRTSGCSICNEWDPERHCRRYLYCSAQDPKLLQKLEGCGITEAPKGGRLKSTKKGQRVKWVHLADIPIDFVTIEKRPEVLARGCPTDTTIMVDWETLEVVGTIVCGVFQPALLKIIQTNQEEHIVKNVTRRPALQALSHGTMTSNGVSQVAGGAPLQTYGLILDAESPDGLISVYRAAMDGAALGEVARATVPGYRADHNELAATSDMAWLGTQVGTLYYCTNYLSCGHEDDDANPNGEKHKGGLLQPCMQTYKGGCKKGEFDFLFLQWGVRLQTETNTIWCFNATHMHASCSPSKSTMDSGQAVSRGQHKSARRKDALAASRRKKAAASFNRRQEHFAAQEGENGENYDADEE